MPNYLRVTRVVVPLLMCPLATEAVEDMSIPREDRGVTLHIHLPPGCLDVESRLAMGDLVVLKDAEPPDTLPRRGPRLMA